MKEKLLQQLSELIEKSTNFTVEQLPDVARQFITYGRWIETLSIGFSIIFLLAAYKLWQTMLRVCRKNSESYEKSDELIGMYSTVAMLFSFFISLIFFFSNISDFFMAWTAPKIYLLQELSHMAHGACK